MTDFRIVAHFYQLPSGELDCALFLPGDTHGRGNSQDISTAKFLDSWELDLSDTSYFARRAAGTVLSFIGHDEKKMKKAARIVLSLYEKGYLRGQHHARSNTE